MYDDVKKQIDSRYSGIADSYVISDAALQTRLQALFREINALGETASNADDFESRLAGSPLMSEYSALFSEISATCPLKELPDDPVDDSDIVFSQAVEDAKSSLIWNIPILGHILRTKSRVDYIKDAVKNRGRSEDEDDDD